MRRPMSPTAACVVTWRFSSSRLLKNRLLRPILVMCAARTRTIGRIRGRTHTFGRYFSAFSALQADSSYHQKFWDADEVVCGSSEHEEPLDQAAAAMPRLAQTADRFDPPERFFDLLTLDGADPITRMAGRACIDRRAAVGIILRDMRRATALTAAGNKVSRVIGLVPADCAARSGIVLDHVERRGALGRTASLAQASIDQEPV